MSTTDPPPKLCVRCNLPLVTRIIPCPQGRPGCLVLHYGERCPHCGGAVYA